jgi:ketosteroid isomerase-like protein
MTTYAPEVRAHRRHINYWLVAVIGLAAALVALGAWVLVDRYTGPENDATALIDDVTAAWSNGDVAAMRDLYASDVVYVEPFGDTVTGLKSLIAVVPSAVSEGFTLERVAPVTVEGDFATTFIRYSTNSGQEGTVVAVYQIENGKVVGEWALQPGETPPLDNAVMP